MADKTWLDKAADQIAQFTPKTGYNVVAVDRMEKPGEALYLVEHYDDAVAAEKARAAHEKKSGNPSYVYGANTRTNVAAMKR
jgi:hypothetical protein